ncbi:hypothetical protein CDD80_1276 [Ophiocordyceps camponoti-rufipedis]|uniref:MHD domain-containing protein n=1 Tax=Ophiocordyceps camponoti-rufipedis TaxID=2004952 RepID=A0A2C5XXU9_9HYPO|nr:hypothetical protein CDD80_1276 [Ophiocordyceps camponoti-rufipedis]
MISGVLVFNQKGENLIFRAFRNDCRPRLADVFRIQVISNAQVRSPILTLGSTTFSHVKHENIYLVAITKSNANAALVFEFLYRLIQLGKGYFGKFDEEAVKNNFVLVYELLDEIIDFGYPQNTETDTLKMYITTEGVKSEVKPQDTSKITMQATGALSWRKANVRYRKNEAFVDVIEDVNLLMSATGAVLRADVTGQIIMRAYLSGTPECKFGLNDRLLLDNDSLQSYPSGNRTGTKATKAAAGSVTLEDCQFHQCVKLGKFDSDRIISFVPPDGEFELMRYRATENVNLPFKVHAIVNEVGRTKVEYSIGIKANFGPKLFATNVVVRIPTPLNTAKITERCTLGKAKYEPSENNIVWKVGRFTGQSEYVLSAEAILTSMTNQRAWSRPPLSLDFSLLMFTSSGLLVRYLKVFEKSNYSSVKWVRYMTRAGSYEIRKCSEEAQVEQQPPYLCGHLSTQIEYCSLATTDAKGQRWGCDQMVMERLTEGVAGCPLKHCWFRVLGGIWRCCQCGQEPNRLGWCAFSTVWLERDAATGDERRSRYALAGDGLTRATTMTTTTTTASS